MTDFIEIKVCFVLLYKMFTNEKVYYPVNQSHVLDCRIFNALLQLNCIQAPQHQGLGCNTSNRLSAQKSTRKVGKSVMKRFARLQVDALKFHAK